MHLMDPKLLEYRSSVVRHYLGAAREFANKGSVENVKHFLDEAYGNAVTSSLWREVNSVESSIMEIAYRNGVQENLRLAEESVRVSKTTGIFFKKLTVLLGFNCLNSARNYAQKAGLDIGESALKIEEELNSLGLQEFLNKPL